jgi:exodeoxyribonuclease-5
MTNFTLSEDQEIVYNTIAKWLSEGGIVTPSQTNPKILTMGGIAGSGKTTLVSHLANEFKHAIRFAFCALSGRAASVLGKKLKEQGIAVNDGTHYCGTIHKLIYKPVENDKGEVIYWSRNKNICYDVIILDEASMISEEIFNDLLVYGMDILAIGDHGQLPPIEGKFSLMKNPDLKLEKIHRQAENNPIINLSFQIRNGNYDFKNYKSNEHISIIKKNEYIDFLKETYKGVSDPLEILESAVLCYTNATRCKLNTMLRNIVFGISDKLPLTNDVVICLKNSNKREKTPFYNGYRGFIVSSVVEFDEHYISGMINFPYEDMKLYLSPLCKHQFGFAKTFSSFDELKMFGMEVRNWGSVGYLFDYGYSMTVHKMQGSQANNIIVFNERPSPVTEDNYRRWAYTAVTRSTDKLAIII